VRLHDLATNATQTIATARLAAMEDIGAASVGGDLVAWVRWLGDGAARMELHEAATGAMRSLELEARPFAIALDATGEHLAWDDARGGKYVVRLADTNVRRFAGDEGWGLTVAGQRFSWAPAPAYGGTGGFFDLGADQLRLVERLAGVQVNQASVFGDWFAWQELRTGTDGALDLAASGYYFLPLAGGS
jgi:hypothetical protein